MSSRVDSVTEQGESHRFDSGVLSDRLWEALGQIRRMEDQGLTAARQVGCLHLATLKAAPSLRPDRPLRAGGSAA